MKRNKIYAHPYWKWEDYLGGMYNDDVTQEGIKKAMHILGTPELCKETMEKALKEYKCAAETNLLSDVNFEYSSDRAWLGAACCNIHGGCTVSEVRNAWWLLSDNQRNMANSIADEAIQDWKNQYLNYEQLKLY